MSRFLDASIQVVAIITGLVIGHYIMRHEPSSPAPAEASPAPAVDPDAAVAGREWNFPASWGGHLSAQTFLIDGRVYLVFRTSQGGVSAVAVGKRENVGPIQ